ncbi:MAG: ATP-dependent DNA helicase RecG [Thiotrichales bacterium]|nr:ATP-dependent DNA helicase RecG [Thiotrichales bacterium]
MSNAIADLESAITSIKGVGSKTAGQLEKLGIVTVQDLLFHLPLRYQDRTRITPIGAVLPGQEYQVQGEIELAQVRYGRRRSLLCRISDGTGHLTLRLFYFNKAQQKNLERGRQILCYGRVSGLGTVREMIHPEYRLLNNDEAPVTDATLNPVYPATEGLQQNRLRKLVQLALSIIRQRPELLADLLPAHLLEKNNLPPLTDALLFAHRPPADANLEEFRNGTHATQKRLAFEELLSMLLGLQRIRNRVREHRARPVAISTDVKSRLLDTLEFQLTTAQARVLSDIEQDIQGETPMLRLVQGDVGCGKTIVAALAALQVISAGCKAAVMAPTELLCDQHYKNFSAWFEPLQIRVVSLSSKLNKSGREEVLRLLADESPLLVTGTHALFQKDVDFNRLGLVIIDEQHRFGVHQRLTLLKKGAQGDIYPHQLIMTATPIPRTLTMSAYADLDVSVIDELPPGRKPVNTVVLSNERRDEIIGRIQAASHAGRQIYWVCTLIEESEILQCQAATDTFEDLSKILGDMQVALIHGRMPDNEKESIMSEYKQGKIDLLVATTVIEVGVDVPNATLMIIENAERLGLAQLHQLRGRVGRGSADSDCVLMYQPPLSGLARKRLEAMRSTNSGFEIAEKDLQLRGPGELMGTRQAGLPQMHIADLVRDAAMLPGVKEAAVEMTESYPEHADRLITRWQKKNPAYGNV